MSELLLCVSLFLFFVLVTRLVYNPSQLALSPVYHFFLITGLYVGLGGALLPYATKEAFRISIIDNDLSQYQFALSIFLMFLCFLASIAPLKYLSVISYNLKTTPAADIFFTGYSIIIILFSIFLIIQADFSAIISGRVSAHKAYISQFSQYRVNSFFYLTLTFYILGAFKGGASRIIVVGLFILASVPLVYGSRNLIFALIYSLLFMSVSKRQSCDIRFLINPYFGVLIFLSAMWFFYSPVISGFYGTLYKIFAELGNTSIAAFMVLSNDFYQTDFFEKLIHFSKLIVPFSGIFSDDLYFAHVINAEVVSNSYSLSANFIAEYLFYFGPLLGPLVCISSLLVIYFFLIFRHPFVYVVSVALFCLMRVGVRGSMIDIWASAVLYGSLVLVVVFVLRCRWEK